MNGRNNRPFITRKVVEMSARSRVNLLSYADTDFCKAPYLSVKNIIESVEQHMAAYEKEFPAAQSFNVLLCLRELENTLVFAKSLQLETMQPDRCREVYFAVCGALWSVLDRVDNSQDQALAQEVLHVLCEHRVLKQEALCEYNSMRDRYVHQLPVIFSDGMEHLLECRFIMAKKQLKMELKRPDYQRSFESRALKAKAEEVIKRIDTYRFECHTQRKSFDIKLYTSILSKTQECVVSPDNQELVQQYEYLMHQNKQGVGSTRLMITGAMLAFIGVVTVVASLAVKIASAGVSSLVTTPVAALGIGMALTGVTMFCAGMSSGTSAAMSGLRREVNRFNDSQRLSEEERRERNERLSLMMGMRR